MNKIIYICMYLFFSTFGLIMIKLGTDGAKLSFGSGGFEMLLTWKLLLGFVSYIVSFVLWTVVISKFDLSFIYPIATALIFILVMILSALVLKESISTSQIIGVVLIIAGVLISTIRK